MQVSHFLSRQNFKTFDISHNFLPLTLSNLSTLKRKGWLTAFSFLRSVKRRCHGNQLNWEFSVFRGPIFFVALSFGNGLEYRNSNFDFKRLNRMNLSALCTVLVTFSPLTQSFRAVNSNTICGDTAKSAYHTKYLEICWT